MKLLPLIILLAICTAFPAYAVQRNLEVTWELYQDTGVTPAGYRLYLVGQKTPVCSTDDPNATSLPCSLDAEGNSAAFTLTSYNETGLESLHSAPFEYTFHDLPMAAVFSSNPSSGQVPLPVTFDANSSTGTISSYTWDFGDGSSATGQQVQHEYTVAGSYTTTLTITGDNNVKTTQTAQITVTKADGNNHSPIAAINVTPGNGQSPLQVQFDASGSSDPDGDALTYRWDFGDGSQGAGKATSHTYVTTGIMNATLTVTDIHNATSTASVPIMVSAPPVGQDTPTAVITMSSRRIIEGTPCRLSGAQSTPSDKDATITSYQWNFGDGSTASGKKVTHAYSNQGKYTVTLTVQDSKSKTGRSYQMAQVISPEDAQKIMLLQQVYRLLLNKTPTSIQNDEE
jgi:PKD repeat protein